VLLSTYLFDFGEGRDKLEIGSKLDFKTANWHIITRIITWGDEHSIHINAKLRYMFLENYS
jgi:hypothetical protein